MQIEVRKCTATKHKGNKQNELLKKKSSTEIKF